MLKSLKGRVEEILQTIMSINKFKNHSTKYFHHLERHKIVTKLNERKASILPAISKSDLEKKLENKRDPKST